MIRPLLLEAPAAPRPSPLARARAFFLQRWPGRIVAGAFVLWLLEGLLSLGGVELPADPGRARRRSSAGCSSPGSLARSSLAGGAAAVAHPDQADRLVPLHRARAGRPADALHVRRRRAAARAHGLARRHERGRSHRRRAAGDRPNGARRAARGRCRGGPAAAGPAGGRRASCTPAMAYTLLRGGRVVAQRGRGSRGAARLAAGPGLQGPGPRARGGGRARNERARCCARSAREEDAALVVELPVDARVPRRDRAADGHPRARAQRDRSSGADCRTKASARSASKRATARSRSRPRAAATRRRSGAGLLFVAFPDRTAWESGETVALAGTPWPIQYDPRVLIRRPRADPAAARCEREERARPAALRARHRGRRVRGDVRRGARARADAGALDHARRARALRRHREAARGRLRARDRAALAGPARGARRVLQPDVARDRAADARAGRQGAARGGAAHRAPDPDEPAAGRGRS